MKRPLALLLLFAAATFCAAGVTTLTDPDSLGVSSDLEGNRLNVTFTGTAAANTYSDQIGNSTLVTLTNGQNYGPGTGNPYVKITTMANAATLNAWGCGQRQLYSSMITAYGGGDAFVEGAGVTFWGGVTAPGDEGQFVRSLYVAQATSLARTTIKAVIQSALNTTTTQAIPRGATAGTVQTITVASAAGAAVGDWVIVEPHAIRDSDYYNMEAVRLTAVDGTANTISGAFNRSHAANVAIVPATVLQLSNAGQMGQQRWLVNLSQPAYATGTAASDSAGHVTGVGTTWTQNMVGGNAVNAGMISFRADDNPNPPFSTTAPLCDWYPILPGSVTATTCTLNHWAQQGQGTYGGKAAAQGSYRIVPGATILSFSPATQPSTPFVVLSPNSFTWNVGDTVEGVISPDADLSGENLRLGVYSTGATTRSVYSAVNQGYQTIQNAFQAFSAPAYGVQNTPAFNAGFICTQGTPVNYGLVVHDSRQAGIALFADNAASKPHILFQPNRGYAGLYYNPTGNGMELQLTGATNTVPGPGSTNQGKVNAAFDSNRLGAFSLYGYLSTSHGYVHQRQAKTGSYTIVATDACDSWQLSGTGTVTLPSGIPTGKRYSFKKTDAGTVSTLAGIIDGASNYTLTAQGQAVTLEYSGTGWDIIASH